MAGAYGRIGRAFIRAAAFCILDMYSQKTLSALERVLPAIIII
jgi:hypothetical protein